MHSSPIKFTWLVPCVFCLTGLFIFIGCGNSEPLPGIEIVNDLPTATGAYDIGLRLVDFTPLPYDGETGNPWEHELLHDPYFADFSPRIAFSENVAGHHWRAGNSELTATHIKHSRDESYRGAFAMELTAADTDVVLMQTTPELPQAPPEGSWLIARARAWADVPDSLGLVVAYEITIDGEDGGEDTIQEIEVGESHPGDGQWHDIVVALHARPELMGSSITCKLIYRADTEQTAVVDWTSLRITPNAAPILNGLGLNSQELLENPGLGMAFLGEPYGWYFAGYDSFSDAPEVYWTSDLEHLTRGSVMVLSPSEDADTPLRLVQEIPVSESMRGRELVFRLDARCNVPEAIGLQYTSVLNNRATARRQLHPGDGSWRRFELRFPIPQDSLPTMLRFEILRSADRADILWIDRASLLVE